MTLGFEQGTGDSSSTTHSKVVPAGNAFLERMVTVMSETETYWIGPPLEGWLSGETSISNAGIFAVVEQLTAKNPASSSGAPVLRKQRIIGSSRVNWC